MILTDLKLQKLLEDIGQDKASYLLTVLCSLTGCLGSDPGFASRMLKGVCTLVQIKCSLIPVLPCIL